MSAQREIRDGRSKRHDPSRISPRSSGYTRIREVVYGEKGHLCGLHPRHRSQQSIKDDRPVAGNKPGMYQAALLVLPDVLSVLALERVLARLHGARLDGQLLSAVIDDRQRQDVSFLGIEHDLLAHEFL